MKGEIIFGFNRYGFPNNLGRDMNVLDLKAVAF